MVKNNSPVLSGEIKTKPKEGAHIKYQTEYIPFTEEQKQRAAETDLAAFLLSQGVELKRCGSEMLWEDGDRVTIRGNLWYSQYEQVGGNAVQFVQRFYNKSYQDAVQMLLNEKIEPMKVEQRKQDAKHFVLPKPNKDMRQVFAYLLKSRFIDREIIKYFAHEKLLYESEKHHNCVFVGVDENGVPRHAHKRGTYTLGESFKGNEENCDSRYSFHYTGASDRIYVFEAPIDMLSYITLHKNNWQEHSYVSLCSVADHALVQMLKDNPQINKIYLCLDHDSAGIESEWRIRHHLNELGYTNVSFVRPKYKDWNEILKAQNGIEPLPAVPNPYLENMRGLLSSVVENAANNKPLLYPYKTLCADYQRLTAAKDSEMTVRSANRLAVDALRMAKAYLNADEKTLVKGFYEQYLPHTEKACYENKVKALEQDIETVGKLFGNPQIRIKSILESDVRSLFKLACDSLKIQSHIETEETQNLSDAQEGCDEKWVMCLR